MTASWTQRHERQAGTMGRFFVLHNRLDNILGGPLPARLPLPPGAARQMVAPGFFFGVPR